MASFQGRLVSFREGNQPVVKLYILFQHSTNPASRYTCWRHRIQELQGSLPIANLFTCTDSSTKGKDISRQVRIHEQEFEGLKNAASWWLNQPIWKICSSLVKLDHFPKYKNKNIWNHHPGSDLYNTLWWVNEFHLNVSRGLRRKYGGIMVVKKHVFESDFWLGGTWNSGICWGVINLQAYIVCKDMGVPVVIGVDGNRHGTRSEWITHWFWVNYVLVCG